MLPGVLAMLLVARQLPLAIQEVGMGVVLSGFVVAGAVKGLGLRAEIPLFRLAVERFFPYLTDMATLLGGFLVLGLIAAGLGTVAAQVVPISHQVLAIPVFLVLAGPLLYRFWPVLSLSYLLPDADAAPGAVAPLWDRLSFAAAARLTRIYDPRGLTWLVLAACYASLLTLALIAGLPGEVGLRPLLIGAFYLIFLPVTIFVVVVCGYQLWAEAFGEPLPWGALPAGEHDAPEAVAETPAEASVEEVPTAEAGLAEAEPAEGDDAADDVADADRESLPAAVDEPVAVDEDRGEREEALTEAAAPAPEEAPAEASAEAAEAEEVSPADPPLRPYAYLRLFPADVVPPISPFGEGGAGMYFVYLSCRNVCTYLFNPRSVDAAFLRELYQHFALGNATLYIVEKWFVAQPEAAAAQAGERPPAPRSASGTGVRYGVFRDPAQTPPGGAAFVTEYQNPSNAAQATFDLSRKHQVAVLAGRIVEVFNWD